jgi:hypothetical protein
VPKAPTGVEPVMEVLQTSALPLGYGAEGAKDNRPPPYPPSVPMSIKNR